MLWVIITTVCRNSALVRLISPSTSALVLLSRLPVGSSARTIAVSVVLWEMYVEVKVTDTGKGISESNQAAIFRRFYREEEVHEQQGVGIGLYLAREIVTRQGGYIKVVSEPGKGSEFSIMLPTK